MKTVARIVFQRKSVFRVMAVALLAVFAGFIFPESQYSVDKVFIKAPSPQTGICSLFCDDMEDSNDCSTGVHFFQGAVATELTFSSLPFVFNNSTWKEISLSVDKRVYLRHRQLLI